MWGGGRLSTTEPACPAFDWAVYTGLRCRCVLRFYADGFRRCLLVVVPARSLKLGPEIRDEAVCLSRSESELVYSWVEIGLFHEHFLILLCGFDHFSIIVLRFFHFGYFVD